MQWTKPSFEEISLAMEVTAYVNTDDPLSRQPRGNRGASQAMRQSSFSPAAGDFAIESSQIVESEVAFSF
jgi:coenzyme PQQ precursor peptide PqqA